MSDAINGRLSLLAGLTDVPEDELAPARTEIRCDDRDLGDVADDAIEAIRLANSPSTLFQSGGAPARVAAGGPDSAPRIEALDFDAFRGHLARVAGWSMARSPSGGPLRKRVFPPADVVRDLLALPGWDAVLPRLRGIVDRPVFTAGGVLVTAAGYDAGSQLWLAPAPGLVVPEIAAEPGPHEVDAARALLLDELLYDFSYADQASRANALALLLLPLVRPMIDGPTPLHLVEASCIGTGKGLLVDACHIVATGRVAAATAEVGDDDEWRKSILALLMGGPELVLIDNVNGFLDSGALAGTLTARSIDGRVLHSSRTASPPVRCVWAATGNNVRLSPELARRTALIRLVATTARPWERPAEDFKHPELRGWASESRGELVAAALTLCAAWVAAGRPQGPSRVGRFEDWSAAMSGILEVVGVAGFMGNAGELTEHNSDDDALWSAFVAAWWSRFKSQPTPAKELLAMVEEQGLLKGVVDTQDAPTQKVNKLGKRLRNLRDRYFGDLRVTPAGKAHNGSQLLRLEDGAGNPAAPGG